MARLYGTIIDGGGGDSNASSPEIAAVLGSTIKITGGVPLDDIAMLSALWKTDPDLEDAWLKYQAGDIDGMQAAILRSNFYRTFNKTARERRQAEFGQPDVWKQDLTSFKLRSKKRLVEQGIAWNTAVEAQVERAYRYGMDDNSLDQLIVSVGTGKIGGGISAQINQLKAYASAFGVDSLYNDSYWNNQSTRLFAGETTDDDIQNDIRALAAETYPAFADGFNTGRSLDAQTAYIKQTIATQLEIDPNTLNPNDPRMVKWLQYQDPKTGQFVRPPQWMVAREARKDPAWGFTNNARTSVDGILRTALTDMGLM